LKRKIFVGIKVYGSGEVTPQEYQEQSTGDEVFYATPVRSAWVHILVK